MSKTRLDIAEIPYEDGSVQFRYSRYLSEDESRWVRHGRFTAYHRNQQLASEGQYVDGFEEGRWSSYHENGRLAAEGEYSRGEAVGQWRYWSDDGVLESDD